MFFKKNQCKKKHPYRGLAVFTLAAAGVIGITEKCKRFIKEKCSMMSSMIKPSDKGGE